MAEYVPIDCERVTLYGDAFNQQRESQMFYTPEAAQKALVWINARLDDGLTVYLTTYTKSTALKAKHRNMIRVRGTRLEVQHGHHWLNHSGSKISAA